MIPKVIHYCWFGGAPLPRLACKCIDSWKKFFPDYEIREWNEENFDVDRLPFTREAYAAKKYAYVSDVARFFILYHEGGIYFDTDVEVLAPFDDVLARGAFMGVQEPGCDGSRFLIAPGLGIGAEAENHVMAAMLKHYEKCHYLNEKGEVVSGTVCEHTTDVLTAHFGLLPKNEIQEVCGMTIYPSDYFNPFDDNTGVLKKTDRTHSVHWYAKSWTERPMWYFRITRLIHRLFGVNALAWLR